MNGPPANLKDHLPTQECEDCGGVMIVIHCDRDDRLASFRCTSCDEQDSMMFRDVEKLDLQLIKDFQLFNDIKLWDMSIQEREDIFEDYTYEELEEEVKKP